MYCVTCTSLLDSSLTTQSITRHHTADCHKCNDVCLEEEASPRGSKSAASASPRRFDASPRSRYNGLGLVSTRGIGTCKLRYDIFIVVTNPRLTSNNPFFNNKNE